MSLRVLMKTHFFAVSFPVINQCLGVDLLETVDEFSLIYIFTIIFVNNVYQFNNVSYLVFHRKKTKLGIQKSVLCFSNVKRRKKMSQIHIFKNSLLKNESKLDPTLNTLQFIVKEQMVVWVQSSKSCISLKKRMVVGCNFNNLHFSEKKGMAVWVNTFVLHFCLFLWRTQK